MKVKSQSTKNVENSVYLIWSSQLFYNLNDCVHFLYQTDIGLTWRKDIYSSCFTSFCSPCSPYTKLSFLSIWVFATPNLTVVSTVSVPQTFLLPIVVQTAIYFKVPLCRFLSILLLKPHSPTPLPPSPPLSHPTLSLFPFAQLFCCRFDRYD